LNLSPGASILDVGCGTGRHAVELARKGFAVTGIDFSSGMLAQAREKAKAAKVAIEWIQENACTFSLDKQFDGVICLCEGSFGLLGGADDANEQPLAILHNVSRSLKPGGKTLFTMLNAFKMIRERTPEDIEQGRFDPLTMTATTDTSPGEGQPALRLRERAFTPTEITLLFQLASMKVLNIWGGTAGNWGKRAIELDEFEIMVVAQKGSQ
jgi:SAM-dependent methyltransferase